MTDDLKQRLLDNRVTGFNLTIAAVEAADLIEQLEKERDQLREQVALLREALDVCAETFSIPVIRETAKEALAATEPKL